VYLLKSFVYWMLATALNTVKRFSKRQGTLVEVCELKACLRWAWFKQNHLSPKNNWQLKTASRSCLVLLRSEISSSMCAKLCTMAASNNRDHPTRSLLSSPLASTINCSPGSQASLEVTHQDHSIGITLLFLVRTTYIIFVLQAHAVRGESHNQRNTTGEVATTSPPFSQWTTLIARSLCEGRTWHDLYILVTTPFSCDRKSRAACAQSFAPWQQATIEITWRDHSRRHR